MRKPANNPELSGPVAPPPAPLDPESTLRLTEFARACKAAARAVSLYPASHPAIRISLERLSDAVDRATMSGPLTLTILPAELQAEGRSAERPEESISELAALLHGHRIGALTIHHRVTTDTLREFLALVARTPEEVAESGGVGELWRAHEAEWIELREIDYRDVLKEHRSRPAAWDEIIARCYRGDRAATDRESSQVLFEAATNAERLGELLSAVEEHAESGGDAHAGSACLRLLRELVDVVSSTDEGQIDAVLKNMATAVASLPPDAVCRVLQAAQTDSGDYAGLVQAIRDRLDDSSIANFVGRSVVNEQTSSARLAEAFQTLVPQSEDRHRLVQIAHDQVAQSEFGQQEGFESIWQNVTSMLTSYSDQPYVSRDYGRELTRASSQPIDVDQVTDDPPDRISSWLGSVSDAAVRALDLDLLLDILSVEQDPEKWTAISLTAVGHLEDLLLIGDFEAAARLATGLAILAADESTDPRTPAARLAVKQLVSGPMIRHLVGHFRTLDDPSFERVKDLAQALGAVVIEPLAEALAQEEHERPRKRLTDLLKGFGALGRRSVEQLTHSSKAAVRRTAILLLREFGGRDALHDLESLLDDREPHVQRDAIRAIIALNTNEAYAVLEKALSSGTTSSRNAIMQSLGSMRDEHAAPLFSYIVSHVDHKGPLRNIYVRAVESLGSLGDEHSVDALKEALYRGEWYAPLRTSALRQAAASALGRIGTRRALEVLEEAAGRGPRGVRTAARGQLARRLRS